MNHSLPLHRRHFLKTTLAGAAGASLVPTIIPSSVLGADAPSNKIQIGQIGCGRIGHDMDMPGILKHDRARIVAVCDLDSKRLQHAKAYVEGAYAKKKGSANAVAVQTFGDYRELLRDGHVDAIAVSTSEHWHAELVIAGALAGKDIYVQKPLSMTLAEGRAVSDIVRAKKRAFQIGSQQRSTPQFRIACELVRNGRLGKLHTVKIGLPVDPSGGDPSGNARPAQSELRHVARLHTRRRPTPRTACTRRTASATAPAGCALNPTAWA